MEESLEKFGAIGDWKKIDETFDTGIVKQTNDASCVAAVGEMLARYYGLQTNQAEILESIGIWSNAFSLAKFLNSKETAIDVEWIGGGFPDEPKFISGITRNTNVWGAMLRDGKTRGHAVLISGQDEDDLIKIKDPFDQTAYKMEVSELHSVLSEFVLRRNR